jgi:hypothetical protein
MSPTRTKGDRGSPRNCAKALDFGGQVRIGMRLVSMAWIALLICLFSQSGIAAAATPPVSRLCWFYLPCNFEDNGSVREAISLLSKGKECGYNGVVVSDPKFGAMKQRPLYYITNLRKFIRQADSLSIEIIPAVVNVGGSEALLQNDPSLAEGMPVKECVFRVQGGKTVIDDRANYLDLTKNSGSETDYLKKWDYVDSPHEAVNVQSSGTAGPTIQMKCSLSSKSRGMVRVSKKLKLRSFGQYQVDLEVKTVGVDNPDGVHITVIGLDDKKPLNYSSLGVKKNQDWTKHSIIIDTMANSNVVVWLGCWDIRDGVVYLRNPALYAVGGVNLVRREGCPVKVTDSSGDLCYEEGKDFLRWEYKDLGNNGWLGKYHIAPPQVPIQITDNSAIREGQKIKVSYYYVPVIYDGQVGCCLTHPKTFAYFQEELQSIIGVFQPKRILLNYDEIRVAGQCELCRAQNKTCGQLLGDHIRKIREMVKAISPQTTVYVWNDMFDPYQNAVDDYYFAASTFKDSWQGLDDGMKVLNWNYPRRNESLRFFSDKGMAQLISSSVDVSDYEARVKNWVSSAGTVKRLRLEGYMYTTWQKNYREMKHYHDILSAPP